MINLVREILKLYQKEKRDIRAHKVETDPTEIRKAGPDLKVRTRGIHG